MNPEHAKACETPPVAGFVRLRRDIHALIERAESLYATVPDLARARALALLWAAHDELAPSMHTARDSAMVR